MGQAQRGQPTLASPPGALGPRHRWGQSVNSQARLWVLGALVHPWLLSRQDFPGIRCCLGNPGGRRHVSPTRKCPVECPHPQPHCRCVRPRLPQGVGCRGPPAAEGLAACSEPRAGQDAIVLTAPSPICAGAHGWHVACGGGKGKQPPARGTCLAPFGPVVSWGSSASRTASISLGKFGEISLPSLRRWQQGRSRLQGAGPAWLHGKLIRPGARPRGCLLGRGCRPAPPEAWAASRVDAEQPRRPRAWQRDPARPWRTVVSWLGPRGHRRAA